MRTSFDVSSATGSYPVHIGTGLIDEAMAAGGERLFVVDAYLAGRFRDAGIDALTITADEPAKSLERMTEVIVALRERRATRATELVAVGGGVVQDVAAFAASIYMRGLRWTYAPTTLLAMADSCIGGKSSINVGRYKNIVGTFHPPGAVLVDPALTESLSAEQRAAGLCEAAKICLCRGGDTFDTYLALDPSPAADTATMAAICTQSLMAKKWFIETDEFDRAERLLLNFGHTFGHALEAATDFGVSHGIAVGLGMIAAMHLGEAMGRRYPAGSTPARFRAHVDALLTVVESLPATLTNVSIDRLMDAFGSDKKHRRDAYAVITVGEAGDVRREFLPRDATSDALIAHAFRAMIAERCGGPASAPASREDA